jgi:hypothetical protein
MQADGLPMAEFSIDRFVELYADRTAVMSASEVRALFAVASRPEIVSFVGGMPYVQALPRNDVLAVVAEALEPHGSTLLQYAGGQEHLSSRASGFVDDRRGRRGLDCEVAFDKVLAKDALTRVGVETPNWVAIEGWALRDLGAGAALSKPSSAWGSPVWSNPPVRGPRSVSDRKSGPPTWPRPS